MALVERSGSLASCRVTIYRTKHGEDRHRSLHVSSEMPTRCSRRESHERKNVHGCKTMSIHTRTVHEYAFDRSRARKGKAKEAKQKCQKRKQTKKIERKRKEKKKRKKEKRTKWAHPMIVFPRERQKLYVKKKHIVCRPTVENVFYNTRCHIPDTPAAP